jgi:hypothetical protein
VWLSNSRTVMCSPFGTSPGSHRSTVSPAESEPSLADELEDDGGDERLGHAGDTEAVPRAHRCLLVDVAVSARQPKRPVAFANERDRTGRFPWRSPGPTRAASSPAPSAREGCENNVHSGCGFVVLVHETSEPVAAVDMAVAR